MFKLLELIEQFNDSDIQLVSLHEKLETDSLIGRLLCMILGFVAESELENLRFRTREGLRKAKEKGVKLGAKRISKKKEERIIQQYLVGGLSIRKIAKTEQISTSTIVYRLTVLTRYTKTLVAQALEVYFRNTKIKKIRIL